MYLLKQIIHSFILVSLKFITEIDSWNNKSSFGTCLNVDIYAVSLRHKRTMG